MSTATTRARRPKLPATDAITEFFTELASRGHEPLLQSASGTLRFDVRQGPAVEHWFVTLARGNVTVSRRNAKADAVVRVERDLFEGMVSGRVNATAAQLRGVMVTEGDIRLPVQFQRVFPGLPRSRPKVATTARETERTSR